MDARCNHDCTMHPSPIIMDMQFGPGKWLSSARPMEHRQRFRDASHVSVPDEFRQYRDLDGNLQKVIAGSIAISSTPILVETATAF